MNEEEKTFSLRDQLQKVDQRIRNLFFDHEKKEASFEERVKKYNNLIPLLRKEIKEKDFVLNKYIKAIEIKKKPSQKQEAEIKKYEELEIMAREKFLQGKKLLREAEKESENIKNLKKNITNLESEKANLKKMIQDIIVHDKGSDQTTEDTEDDDFVIYGEPDSPENMKKKYKILLNEANKVGSGYYEGSELIQAKRFYTEIIEGNKNSINEEINEKFVDGVLRQLKNYEIDYNLKLKDAADIQSDLNLKSQELKTEIQKNKSAIETVASKVKSNSGEFVGGSDFFVSFCDVQSVLLCFFVVFFSISNQDYEKFEAFFATWNDEPIEIQKPNNASLSKEELKIIGKVKKLVKKGVDPETIIRNDADKLRFIFPNSDLFSAGGVKVSSKGLNNLKDKFEGILSKGGIKQIRIEGHIDKKELAKNPKMLKKYYNNLTFSVARASAIATVFNKNLRFPKNTTIITGYGSRKSPESNSDKSRIEIEIIRDKKVEKT